MVSIEAVTKLISVLIWPLKVLIVLGLLRHEIAGLFGRVREIAGPGDLKVSLNPNKVEQIIEEGRKENSPPAVVAERILQSATVLDKREARILRALLDDDGREIHNYRDDSLRHRLRPRHPRHSCRSHRPGRKCPHRSTPSHHRRRPRRTHLLLRLRPPTTSAFTRSTLSSPKSNPVAPSHLLSPSAKSQAPKPSFSPSGTKRRLAQLPRPRTATRIHT